MSFLEKFRRIQRLHHLIRLNTRGNHKEMAHKLGIPVSTFYRHLEILKNLGAPIDYCTKRDCYYYTEDFDIKF